jgi:thiamine-phosphate pyrophosphorylase
VSIPAPPLLLITDRRQASGHVLDVAQRALDAGCRWLSLREKDLPADDQAWLLQHLLDYAQACGARVTLHGEAALAAMLRTHGVHLSAGSDTAAARRLLGPDALIGISIHTPKEAGAANPRDLDYVVAAPVFETPSKPGYGPALGPEGLALIVQAARVPVIALGGIRPENVSDCRAAGAAGVAVMGGIMRAPDPAEAVAALIGALAAPQAQPRPR